MKKIATFHTVIQEAIKAIAIFKSMTDMLVNHEEDDVYKSLVNYSALIATIRLANIIGTDEEENHWKHFFS